MTKHNPYANLFKNMADAGVKPKTQKPPMEQKTISLEPLRKNKYFIGTPCYGGAVTEPYFKSMLRLVFFAQQHGIQLQFGTIANESLITRARNTMTAFFMQSDCTHLLFVDADIEFQIDDFIRLCIADKDIVVGAYPKKTVNWESVKKFAIQNPTASAEKVAQSGADYAINFQFDDPSKGTIKMENGLLRLKDGATGFMMIKREVFTRMMEAHPELQYNNDINVSADLNKHTYALFDTMIDEGSRRYLSEDYTFCRRWQKLGGEVWIDPNINLNHFGTIPFRGNPSLILEPAA